jgi:dihydroorotase
MRLKPKLSRNIDGIHDLNNKNGGSALLEHLSLLLQRILTQSLVPSTFCVGYLSPIPKKNEKPPFNAHLSGP